MNFIAKHIQAIGLLMLAGFLATAAALYWDVPARLAKPPILAAVSDKHSGCDHAAVGDSPASAAESSGCAHAGGGCCSSKSASTAPPAGGCTRDLVLTTDSPTP